MKILVVTQYFYPEQFRINDICNELVNRGHRITVVTGLPNYPEGEIYLGYESRYNEPEIVNGIKVLRCKLRPRHKGTINLVKNYISFVLNASKVIKKIKDKFDIVYVYGVSPITQALPAIKFAKKNSIPIYYYCCDLWPEAVLGEQNGHKQISRKNIIFMIANHISKYVYNRVDYIGCKCSDFIEYINSVCKVSKDKMTILFEHAEESYLEVNSEPDNNGIIDFMFLGNIGRAQNCDQIIEATKRINTTNKYKIHFVGDGSELERIKKKVFDEGMEDLVVFHGKQSITDIVPLYNLADICLLTLTNRTATGLTPPGKLIGYMAASRAIIGSINGAAMQIINEANCGMVVKADDVDGLAKLMQSVVDDSETFISKGMNGRKYFLNNFTLDKHIDNLEIQLKQLIEMRKGNC